MATAVSTLGDATKDPALEAGFAATQAEGQHWQERQTQQDTARHTEEAAREAAMVPAEADLSGAMDAPMPKLPGREQMPQPPSGPIVNAKDYEGLGMALLGMALIGGKASHGNWLGVMAPLNGALKGHLEGNEQKRDDQWKDFQAKYKTAQDREERANREFRDALESRKLTINEKLQKVKQLAAYWDRRDMMVAADQKSVDKLWDQYNAHLQSLTKTQAAQERVAAQIEAGLARAKMTGGGADALLDPGELKFMARQYLSGDKSVIQNIGRGRQGAQNIVALRRSIMNEAGEQGIAPEEVATRLAEFSALQAGERALGTRTANLGMAVAEANKLADVALAASEKVDRTKYPTLNQAILAAERGTGDEAVVRLAAATNSLVNVYARAISPSGTPTVSDKEHAREILDIAYSKGQFRAAIDQMKIELKAAQAAPAATKQELRDLHSGKAPAAHQPYEDPAKEQRYQEFLRQRNGAQ